MSHADVLTMSSRGVSGRNAVATPPALECFSPGWRMAFRASRGCFVAALLAMTPAVFAAEAAYPQRPIRFIMPYPAGGTIDSSGRLVAQHLGEALGQQVVVDNRTGAGGTIGTETAAKSPPDGYTIVMGGTGTL